MSISVSSEAARRFLVARHLLAPARSVEGGHDAVLEVVRRLGSIQFDPLAVAGRNHDLVLHARVADYDPAWCEELLYDRRELFEAYNKGLSPTMLSLPSRCWSGSAQRVRCRRSTSSEARRSIGGGRQRTSCGRSSRHMR